MASVVGDIVVRVGANVRDFRDGMRDVGRDSARMSANVAKAGAVVVTAMAAITAGVLAAAKEASSAAVEIKNLADIAGVGTTEFQKMAAASKTVGIEQDKLSDIFKDVNDKFGDYIATGAGPLADFFENIAPKVGVTADEFARLSGPDALQLYVTSLERAGVSQQQMTFYMEALASDATGLVPLLANAGTEMRRLGDAAEAAGRVLDEDAIASAQELDQKLDELSATLKTRATAAILEYSDEIIAAADFILDTLIPAMDSVIGAAIRFAEGLKPAIAVLQEFAGYIGIIARASGAMDYSDLPRPPDGEADAGAIGSANALGGGDTSSTGTGYIDENGNWVEYGTGAATPEIPGITRGENVYSGRGGQGGPSADEILQAQVAAHQAANEEIETEEERHAGRMLEIKEESAAELAAVEAMAARARFQAYSQAFNDVSSLASSENDKLAKIGEAAAKIQIVREGIQSASSAWQKGMQIGGPPLAAAFAAASAAKTAALLGQIGGGGGGSFSGGGSSAGGGQGPLAVTLQGVSPDEFISGASVSDLFERLSDEAGDRGITFVGAG